MYRNNCEANAVPHMRN